MTQFAKGWGRTAKAAAAGLVLAAGAGSGAAWASDHIDSPRVAADPQADIGDLYAWTAPDGKRLNLVMTIVGHSFSDRMAYVFHIDSGKAFGRTTASVAITCRFASMTSADCRLGTADRAAGDASHPEGLESRGRRFRVFAGLRDDPFFNNVRGSRDAFLAAAAAIKAGTAPADPAGCRRFDPATVRDIAERWRHTEDGPARDLLAGWTPASIVISVDLKPVSRGGPLLAVWGATVSPERQVDRAGRPLTGNALIAPLKPEISDGLKDEYNRVEPRTAWQFIPLIQESLGLYDGYDGRCGDQMLAARSDDPDVRYGELATILADDRLWVDSTQTHCSQLFAVELAGPGRQAKFTADCGGRAPSYRAANVYRALLIGGTSTGDVDGLDHDARPVSDSAFPFLAAPDAAPAKD